MNTLSVIVITKNEATHIKACLDSVYFANEIIVLDSGSTDETVAIAKSYTDQVYEVDWPGYGVQKNRALAKASCHWVLSLDADERISPPLAKEIQAVLQDKDAATAYEIHRLSKYCNQMMHFGDWKNDYCLRLFRRDHAEFEELPVHEKLVIKQGNIAKLKHHLLHDTSDSLEEVLSKLNTYSTLSAQHKYDNGRRCGLFTAVLHGLWTFCRGYIFRAGFLDGKKGLMLAISNAEGCYYRYVKIMMLQENNHCGQKLKNSVRRKYSA